MKTETINLKLTEKEFNALAELFFEKYYHSLNNPLFYNEALNNIHDKLLEIRSHEVSLVIERLPK